jgi:hypothetical protein
MTIIFISKKSRPLMNITIICWGFIWIIICSTNCPYSDKCLKCSSYVELCIISNYNPPLISLPISPTLKLLRSWLHLHIIQRLLHYTKHHTDVYCYVKWSTTYNNLLILVPLNQQQLSMKIMMLVLYIYANSYMKNNINKQTYYK